MLITKLSDFHLIELKDEKSLQKGYLLVLSAKGTQLKEMLI
jgi:hypothetical protein